MLHDTSNSAGGTSRAFSESNFVNTEGLQVNVIMPDQAVPGDGLGRWLKSKHESNNAWLKNAGDS